MPTAERLEKTRRKKQDQEANSQPAPTPAEEQPKEPGFVERASADKPGSQRKRVGFNVNEHGAADWESVQPGKRKELIDAIKNSPDLMKALGQDVNEVQFTEADIAQALGFLNGINMISTKIVLARMKKLDIDPDILQACFTVDPKRNKELIERGTRLANKYSTDWMKKYADELFFLSLYFANVYQQVMSAVGLQLERNAQKQPPPAARPNGSGQERDVTANQ